MAAFRGRLIRATWTRVLNFISAKSFTPRWSRRVRWREFFRLYLCDSSMSLHHSGSRLILSMEMDMEITLIADQPPKLRNAAPDEFWRGGMR